MSRENTGHLENRYFERMAASMGDKVKILEHLPAITDPANPPKVLDIGAGGGELSDVLSQLGYAVTAIDAADDAVMRIREKFPYITTVNLLANQVNELGVEEFDAVISSALLHEAFSYGDNFRRKGHYSSLNRALEAFNIVLKKGGVLIIRDGVLPENWEDEGTVTLLDGHDNSVVYKYLEMCPFANGGATLTGDLVKLTQVGEKTFAGNVRSLLEFAYTYTWGLESYPRETQELYAVKTLNEYVELLESSGFTVTHSESYLQPGYSTHLATKLRLEVNGEVDNWFDSNAIWVAIKN